MSYNNVELRVERLSGRDPEMHFTRRRLQSYGDDSNHLLGPTEGEKERERESERKWLSLIHI